MIVKKKSAVSILRRQRLYKRNLNQEHQNSFSLVNNNDIINDLNHMLSLTDVCSDYTGLQKK